jgi:hypothetical protein
MPYTVMHAGAVPLLICGLRKQVGRGEGHKGLEQACILLEDKAGRTIDDEEVICMSTFTVDDELYQRAAEAAAAQGKTVDEFVSEALHKALSVVGVRRTVRNGLPVMVVGNAPPIDPTKVRQYLEEEGF